MSGEVSENTKAILLLTAPLLVGKGRGSAKPLGLLEYNKLARCLSDHDREPADLLGRDSREVLDESQPGLDTQRIANLLERGLLLSQAIERWQSRAIWVVSRADTAYPIRLKDRLGTFAPPIVYGCGDNSLLENGGLAVVGSRDVSEELMAYTEEIGQMAARSRCPVVSGGARGIDQAAMHGALKAGGTAAGVLTNDLEGAAVNREHRDMLLDSQLVLVTPYDPRASFNVGNAMQRNKLIYALADASLVIESGKGSGGTWAGAIEQLEKLHSVPVFTRSHPDTSPGLQALRRKGAQEWPNPETPEEFNAVLAGNYLPPIEVFANQPLPLLDGDATSKPVRTDAVALITPHAPSSGPSEILASPQNTRPSDALFAIVEKLIDDMGPPVTESEVAELLQVERKQAVTWLKRLAQEGKYTRLSRPVRYVRCNRIL